MHQKFLVCQKAQCHNLDLVIQEYTCRFSNSLCNCINILYD
jgi:hypothetical protein